MITTDEKGRFLKWLTKAASYSAVPGIYASLSELDFYCRKRGILKKPLFETHDAVTLGRVRTVIGFDSDFRNTYRNKSKDILSAMQYYAYYVRSEGLEEPIAEDGDEAEKEKDELETEEAAEESPEEVVQEEAEEEMPEDVPVEKAEESPAEVPEEEESEETLLEETEEEDYMPYKKPRAKRYRMEGQYYDWLSRLDRGGKQRGDR